MIVYLGNLNLDGQVICYSIFKMLPILESWNVALSKYLIYMSMHNILKKIWRVKHNVITVCLPTAAEFRVKNIVTFTVNIYYCSVIFSQKMASSTTLKDAPLKLKSKVWEHSGFREGSDAKATCKTCFVDVSWNRYVY